MEAALRVTAKLPQHHSVEYHGIPIVIEWPKGSVREGKDKGGKAWRREMKADYGFIDDTEARGDEEPLDIYIGDDRKSGKVFIIEQLDEDGEFDEYKLVTGVPGLEAAESLYLSHYPREWGADRLGDCYEAPLDSLRRKVEEHQEEDGMKGMYKGEKGFPVDSAKVMEAIGGTDRDKAGTKLTGFYNDGPATCMDCVHRTPHSQREDGTQADSCKHPLVVADPELKDKRLPDGTIEVDADDWCMFARKPRKGGEGGEASGQGKKEPPRKASVGSIYMSVLGSMK
jgi:hypothetical protein